MSFFGIRRMVFFALFLLCIFCFYGFHTNDGVMVPGRSCLTTGGTSRGACA